MIATSQRLPNTERLWACSSVYGKIESILLLYPGTAKEVSQDDILRRYGRILQAFGDRVTFIVLANKIVTGSPSVVAHDEPIASDLLHCQQQRHPRHHLVVLGNVLPLGIQDEGRGHLEWAQDPFVLLTDNHGNPTLLKPIFQTHPQNARIAEELAFHTGMLLRPTRYLIEGGDILVGDDYALIGAATRERNIQHYFQGLPRYQAIGQLEQDFKEMLGLNYIVWLGWDQAWHMPLGIRQDKHRVQPLFHLDLFVCLGGMDEKGRERVFVAEARPEDGLQAPAEWAEFGAALDSIALQLQEASLNGPAPQFVVERIPMGLGMDHGRATIYSYCNAHVECFHGIRRIYLPHYEQFAQRGGLQDLLKRKLSSLNYCHTFIDNTFAEYSRYGQGSLHCLSKVIRRRNIY